MGASSLEELNLIIKYKAPDYETAFSIELGGFPSYEIFEQARLEGYVTFDDFLNNISK